MMLALAMSVAHAAPPAPSCGTARWLRDLPRVRTEVGAPRPPALPGAKSVRDPYGTPNVELSTNFAVHYGNGGGVTLDEVRRLLDAFELAWQVQLIDMGHEAPYGTSTHRFNVYIGDTGDGAPGGYGTGGYYWTDPEDWPVVVVSASVLGDPYGADHTAAHEFYHAVQGATGRYLYDGSSAWYTEATAEWAALETDPANPVNAPFLFAYGLLPHLPVNYFDYPDTGVLEEYYQYGSFLFPATLSELAGWQVIRDSWLDEGTEPDPLEVLRTLLAEQGLDLDEAWLDHIARNAVWDYEQGADYAWSVETYGDWYGIDPVLATYSQDGSGGVQEARGLAPRRYGSNLILLRNPDQGTLDISVVGDEAGSRGSPAVFGARLVRTYDDGTILYDELPFVATTAELSIEVGDEEAIWLVVGAWTPESVDDIWEDERFKYTYDLHIASSNPDSVGVSSAETASPEVVCGCASSPISLVAGLPFVLLFARRGSDSDTHGSS